MFAKLQTQMILFNDWTLTKYLMKILRRYVARGRITHYTKGNTILALVNILVNILVNYIMQHTYMQPNVHVVPGLSKC